MIAIACVDKNNGIGKDGKLLISIPEDMKFFRETTKDSIVIMGRKTLFSFKDKAPLKNRINIVFTNNECLKDNYKDYDNIFFIKSEKELDELITKYKDKEVFVIGGAKIYNNLIDKCDKIYLTRVDKEFEADTFFPNFSDNFKLVDISDIYYYNDIPYQFLKYRRG